MGKDRAGAKEMAKKRLEYVLNKLRPHGPITSRAMFGGYGIYYDEIIFASLIDGKLYFRVDALNENDYELYGSEPFVFEGGKSPAVMPYRVLPDEILENGELLPQWIEKAKQASLRHRRKAKKGKKAVR